MRDDSSSNALADDAGPDLHCVEVEVSGQRDVEVVHSLVEGAARERGVIVEFVDEF